MRPIDISAQGELHRKFRGGRLTAYAVDDLGSVTRLTNASGITAGTYAYDVWGGTASW